MPRHSRQRDESQHLHTWHTLPSRVHTGPAGSQIPPPWERRASGPCLRWYSHTHTNISYTDSQKHNQTLWFIHTHLTHHTDVITLIVTPMHRYTPTPHLSNTLTNTTTLMHKYTHSHTHISHTPHTYSHTHSYAIKTTCIYTHLAPHVLINIPILTHKYTYSHIHKYLTHSLTHTPLMHSQAQLQPLHICTLTRTLTHVLCSRETRLAPSVLR